MVDIDLYSDGELELAEPELADNGFLFDPIMLLNRDLRKAAATLSDKEARFLVDSYYTMQDNRKRADSQIRALEKVSEPHDIITWLASNSESLEHNIRSALGVYAKSRSVGRWAMSITGIGPVISAGLIAHIPMDKTPKTSSLWRFAGQDPTSKWEKGQKRPWNAFLKVLCFHIGESFVKVCNRESDFYGKHYIKWKKIETERNEQGLFREQAKLALETHNYGKDTIAKGFYEQGLLPPAHIHARAKRKATKLFLSHYWEVAYYYWAGSPPLVRPYAIDILGHKHYIEIPNRPW